MVLFFANSLTMPNKFRPEGLVLIMRYLICSVEGYLLVLIDDKGLLANIILRESSVLG
jgi:hypothetical protein